MSYLDTLSAEQKNNIAIISQEAKNAGVTNEPAIAAMLAIISKESSFIPKEEKPYSGTSNERIRKVFGSRVRHLSESELNTLKANPKAFFEVFNFKITGVKRKKKFFNELLIVFI